jgi:hypothetical protein
VGSERTGSSVLAGKVAQAFLDLQCHLSRRRQDESACGEMGGTSGCADQVQQHRQGDCGDLAGCGSGNAEQIVACKQMRYGACLDGRWVNEALSVESAQQRLGQTEGRKMFDGTKSMLQRPSAHGVTARKRVPWCSPGHARMGRTR